MTIDNRKALVEAVDTLDLINAITAVKNRETLNDSVLIDIVNSIKSLIEENGTRIFDKTDLGREKNLDELTASEIANSLELLGIAEKTAGAVRRFFEQQENPQFVRLS